MCVIIAKSVLACQIYRELVNLGNGSHVPFPFFFVFFLFLGMEKTGNRK